MKTILFIASIIFSTTVFAAPACYELEVDVQTKKPFEEKTWLETIDYWNAEEPAFPGIFKLASAWSVYKKALPEANKLKNDKLKHCYMGCKIAQNVSYETAVYVAWYKEQQDLTDCNQKTFFEVKDLESTLLGADIGAQSTEPKACVKTCKEML
jgi:hypothetical protein